MLINFISKYLIPTQLFKYYIKELRPDPLKRDILDNYCILIMKLINTNFSRSFGLHSILVFESSVF